MFMMKSEGITEGEVTEKRARERQLLFLTNEKNVPKRISF